MTTMSAFEADHLGLELACGVHRLVGPDTGRTPGYRDQAAYIDEPGHRHTQEWA